MDGFGTLNSISRHRSGMEPFQVESMLAIMLVLENVTQLQVAADVDC
jgi:hypothetical protein